MRLTRGDSDGACMASVVNEKNGVVFVVVCLHVGCVCCGVFSCAFVVASLQEQSGQFTLRQLHRALEQADPKLLESVGPTDGFIQGLLDFLEGL